MNSLKSVLQSEVISVALSMRKDLNPIRITEEWELRDCYLNNGLFLI